MVAVKEFSWEELSSPDFGNPARQAWPQAVAQVEEQLRAKLRVEVLPERMRKALELVGANAVTLPAQCLPPTLTSAPAVHATPAQGAAPGPAGAALPGVPELESQGQPPQEAVTRGRRAP